MPCVQDFVGPDLESLLETKLAANLDPLQSYCESYPGARLEDPRLRPTRASFGHFGCLF